MTDELLSFEDQIIIKAINFGMGIQKRISDPGYPRVLFFILGVILGFMAGAII